MEGMYQQIDSQAIMTGFVVFHIQGIGQYTIRRKANSMFAVTCINKDLNARVIQLLLFVKTEEQVKLSNKFSETDFDW